MVVDNIEYKIVTSLEEARKYWQLFSPHRTIDDEWDFRYTFFKYLHYKLYFIIKMNNKKPVSLLPLQLNNGEGLMPPYAKTQRPFLEFFGGDDTDDNKILSVEGEKNLLKDFTAALPYQTLLAPLAPEFQTEPDVKFYENKYALSFEGYDSYEDFLKEKWGNSSRKKILQQIRKIYREHKIEILENNYSDIDLLAELNIKRFGTESSFNFSYRQHIFQNLTQMYDVVMLTLIVDGEKEAVSYGINYKNTYVGMNAGGRNKVEDSAKLLIFLQIDKALTLGCRLYDAGKGDSGWKEQFHLTKIPQYIWVHEA